MEIEQNLEGVIFSLAHLLTKPLAIQKALSIMFETEKMTKKRTPA